MKPQLKDVFEGVPITNAVLAWLVLELAFRVRLTLKQFVGKAILFVANVTVPVGLLDPGNVIYPHWKIIPPVTGV